MKVILTGNASADTFYPNIAVAEELNKIIDNENLADTKLYFASNTHYDKKALYENGVKFLRTVSGKSRSSLTSFIGKWNALVQVFAIMPDVVFSTGGYMSYPTLWAAKILNIPVIIHESNSYPDNTNLWASKFAKSITTAYKQEIDFFDKEKLIHIGQPMRHNLQEPTREGAHHFLELEKETPTIWFLGGSSGSKNINRVLEEALPDLLDRYQIIHQTGRDDYNDMKMLTDATLIDHDFKYRYHPHAFLNQLSMKMSAGVADLVIARAGSTLFEIAHWEIPSIIVPITDSVHDHQIKNAYNYAREGGCIVIEENNLSDKGLIFEIDRLIEDKKSRDEMISGAQKFAIKDAGRNIAEEIVAISLSHEK